MLTPILFILGGLLLLVLGAEGLVRGSVALALRLGITPLVVGLIIVAFCTSSPELMVAIKAALSETGNIAVGAVIGSNISNVALILGLSALIRPISIQSQVIRQDMPIMIGVSVGLWLLLLDGNLSRWEGALLFAGLLTYIGFSFYIMQRKKNAAVAEDLLEDVEEAIRRPVWQGVTFALGGLSVLVLGAHLMVTGAVEVAASLGVSDAIIGLTIVALGTSLPELATSAVAAIKKESDLSIGNVIGSNIFNICAILGIASMIHPMSAPDINNIDLAVMVGCSVMVLPLMYTNLTLKRWEGGLLLVGYVVYIYSLIP